VPAFEDVVKTHFAQWDRDNRQALSAQDVERLLLLPGIQGPEAAALASIHRVQRKNKDMAPLTLEQLTSKGTLDLAKLRSSYVADAKHIASASRDLFAKGAPSLDGLHQGRLGDCFVVSAIGAAVARDRERIHKMIVQRSDGSCEVHFPNRNKPILVPRLTDAEIALSSNAKDQGLWLNVLEKAAAIVRDSKSTRKEADPLALDFISRGGDARFSIQLLTGHQAEHFSLRPSPKHSERILLAEAAKILASASEHHRLVCCGTGKHGVVPPGMVHNHDYAVLSYDSQKHLVEVWNPWGNHFTPDGTAGLENGYPTRNGRFVMPLSEFAQVFGGFVHETSLALKH
jgi:hypothetical protein